LEKKLAKNLVLQKTSTCGDKLYYEINIYWMGGLLMKQKMVGWNFDETQTYRMDCFNTQNVGHPLEGLNFQYLNSMGPGPKNKRGPMKI